MLQKYDLKSQWELLKINRPGHLLVLSLFGYCPNRPLLWPSKESKMDGFLVRRLGDFLVFTGESENAYSIFILDAKGIKGPTDRSSLVKKEMEPSYGLGPAVKFP